MEREDRGDESHAIKDWKAKRHYNAENAKLKSKSASINYQILAFLDDCLKNIKSGNQPMELTPGQAERRDKELAAGMEHIDRDTEKVAEWWMAHQRHMADIASQQRQKERDSWRRPEEDEIADANVRWSKACNIHGNMRDPDSSMASAARAEGAMFREEQEELRKAKSRESDPAKREIIQLRRHVEASEYMASTSERLAGISKFISGRPGSESEEYYKAEAGKYREIAAAEREKLSELRELMDKQTLDKLHEGLKEMDGQERADPFLRRMNRPTQVPEKEQFFGLAQDLPENAPNRDRPQNDQRASANHDPDWRDVGPDEVFEPGRQFRMDQTTGTSQVNEPNRPEPPRENLYEAAAGRDQDRRKAGEELTDAKKERPEPELSDAEKERMATLSQKWNAEEREIQQSQERSSGMSR